MLNSIAVRSKEAMDRLQAEVRASPDHLINSQLIANHCCKPHEERIQTFTIISVYFQRISQKVVQQRKKKLLWSFVAGRAHQGYGSVIGVLGAGRPPLRDSGSSSTLD